MTLFRFTLTTIVLALFITAAEAQPKAAWVTEVAAAPGVMLGGCAIGDLLAEHPGNEVVAVGADGSIHVARRERGQWKSRSIHKAAGALVQVAVGDVLPDRAGSEIIAVGMAEGTERDNAAGAALVLHRTGAGWKAETAFTSKALVHGVCVLDGKAYVTGYDAALHRLERGKDGWTAVRVAALPAAGKSVVPQGHDLVVACTDGTVARAEKTGDGWTVRAVDRREPGRARVGTDGERIVVADDDGTVSLLDRKGGADGEPWQREELFRDSDRARGAVLADLVPERRGLEIATAGYSGKVTLIRGRSGHWRRQTLLHDKASLHHLVAGELDGKPGLELATCGYSGRLMVLRRDVPTVVGPQAGPWQTEVALDLGVGIGGCAVGDLMAERPGDEIVAVSRDGAVNLVYRDGDRWVAREIYRARGELIQVSIGDVDPRSEGQEIIGVGMAEGRERTGGQGAAVVVRRIPDGWHGEVVFTAPALLHGACAHEGAAFVTGYDMAVHRLRCSGTKWEATKLADLTGAGKQALTTPHGVVVGCRDGALLLFRRAGKEYSLTTLDRRKHGRSRLGTDGTRIIVSDDDGTLSIVSPTKDEHVWQREEIHREFALQRGAVLADLDPETPGLEAATAGYECKITLLSRLHGRWWSRMLFCDRDRLHHLAAGHVDGRPGLDLVACGYSGRVLVLHRTNVAK